MECGSPGCKPADDESKKAGRICGKGIEFYTPNRLRKSPPCVPPQQRGKVIEFPLPAKKSA